MFIELDYEEEEKEERGQFNLYKYCTHIVAALKYIRSFKLIGINFDSA